MHVFTDDSRDDRLAPHHVYIMWLHVQQEYFIWINWVKLPILHVVS